MTITEEEISPSITEEETQVMTQQMTQQTVTNCVVLHLTCPASHSSDSNMPAPAWLEWTVIGIAAAVVIGIVWAVIAAIRDY